MIFQKGKAAVRGGTKRKEGAAEMDVTSGAGSSSYAGCAPTSLHVRQKECLNQPAVLELLK
jgi:hypothetical protein